MARVKINKKINCRTSNVVYAVHCKKCKHIVYGVKLDSVLKSALVNITPVLIMKNIIDTSS
jgi:hypothetical protein